MRTFLIAAIAAVSALTISAPAEATRYSDYNHGRHYDGYSQRQYNGHRDGYYQPRYRSNRGYYSYREAKRFRHFRNRDRHFSSRVYSRGYRHNGYYY